MTSFMKKMALAAAVATAPLGMATTALADGHESLKYVLVSHAPDSDSWWNTIKNGIALVQLDGGGLIDCKPVNVSKAGERTRVSIRPERVEFDKTRLHADAHTLKAEVLEFIYMGDIFRTRLRVAGNEDFIIKSRNAPDQVRLEPGSEIEIGWLAEDCRALDA